MVWYYFRHLLGFAIQIFGAMALCFIPWDRGSYRYSTKIIFPCFALAVIAFSALFPLPLMTVEGDEQRQVVANMYMLGAVLVCCVAYFALIKEHAVKKLLVVNLAVVYAVEQFITVNLVTVYSNGAVDGSVYSPMDFYGYCVTTVIYFPVTAAIMQRVVKRYLKNADPSLMMREFLCVFILSLVYIVTLIVYYSIIMADSSTAYDHFWYVCIPFLFSAVVLVVFYWAILRESVRRKEEYERRRHDEIQKLQYEHINRDIQTTRRLRHDMRHYMNAIADMAADNNCAAITAYISELTGLFTRSETAWYCNNLTINGLLQNYIGRAEDEGITCTVNAACGELSVHPVDLTVILGNALENSVRAAAACSNKWLRVEIGVVGSSLAIQVANSCEGVHFAKGMHGAQFLPAEAFISDRAGGGFGLRSIALAAEKYDGEAAFCYNAGENSFTARILLNLIPVTGQ